MRLYYDPPLDYDFPADDGPQDVLTPAELDAHYRDMDALAPPPPTDADVDDMAQRLGCDDVPF